MKHSWKKAGCLLLSLAMALTLLPAAALAADETAESGFAPTYTYSNNGYTLEKVSHAETPAGESDGFVDYYQYTDPDGSVRTGVVEHVYGQRDWTGFETMLKAKYPAASEDEIARMLGEIQESLTGDACQSYAFSALGYGDWVYIGTMYGGTGITKNNARTMFQSMGLLKDEKNEDGSTNQEAVEYNQQLVDNAVALLYGDNYYTEHPVPTQGVLFKINVKTGESKILMAGSVNGYQVTLRNAVAYNGRFYFIGTQVGTENVADAATGIPSIFEVNPEDDSFRTVYQAVTMEEYRSMQAAYVFPIPRAIAVYKGSLIASVTRMDGAHIIAYTPDADDFNADGSFKGIQVDGSALRNPEFQEIAEQSQELFNYPAYHMYDANYGGTVYQMIEYNGKLYMAINAGQKALHSTLNPTEGVYTAVDPDTLEETECFAGYAILEGTLKDGASPSDRGAWTWTPIVGNTADDQWDDSVNHADTTPAMYTFNIDPNRFAAAICTMEVYNGYLYIGDYNDVTQATYPMLKMDFVHLATVLSQSVNLYRMDGEHNIELVVGDATKTFPDGSLSGWESGYTGLNGHGSRINQYTSMTQIWDEDKSDNNDGVMLLGTLDEGSLLRPMVKITNGDVLKMSEEEWAEKINYLKVLLRLLLEQVPGDSGNAATAGLSADDALTAEEQVAQALDAAQRYETTADRSAETFHADGSDAATPAEVTLTDEQTASLVEAIENGTIRPHTMSARQAAEVMALPNGMGTITELFSANGQENIEAFYRVYKALVEYYEELKNNGSVELPEELEKVLDQVLTQENATQLKALLTCLNAVSTSVVGCDTYAITTDADGSNLKIDTITLNGLGDDSNQTMRNFAITDDYVVFIPGNAIRGGSVYRLTDWPGKTVEAETYTVTLNGAGTGAAGAGEYAEGAAVSLYAGTRTGYTFSGWTSDDVAILSAGNENASFVMPAKNVTVQANWTANGTSGGSTGGGSTGGSGSGSGSTEIPDPSVPGSAYNYSGVSTCQRGKDCPISRFQDASANAWYHDGVHFCLQNGLMLGVTGDTFQPDAAITRGMIAAMLYRVEGQPAVSGSNPFPDVKSGSYCDEATAWAAANGIVNGYESGEFRPSQTITRQEMAAILYRYAQYKKLDTSVGENTNILRFEDASQLSEYAIPAMQWAVGAGVINGTTASTLSPSGDASRAQAANILYRFLSTCQK